MFGSRVLVFPDTGPEFLRSVRIAALYSEHVATLTILDRAFATSFNDHCGTDDPRDAPFFKRLQAYFSFIVQHFDELDTFRQAGVLSTLSLDGDGLKPSNSAVAEVRKQLFEHGGRERFMELWTPQLQISVESALQDAPPTFADFDMLHPFVQAAMGKRPAPPVDDLQSDHFHRFLKYLLMVVSLSELQGVTPMSWSRRFRDAMLGCRRILMPVPADIDMRRRAEAELAETILTRYLPATDDLHANEILKIRERRHSELERFRSAVAQLATSVDVSQPIASLELQIRDLVASHVDPALRDLRTAIRNSRLELLMRGGKSAFSAGATAVPAVFAYAVGAPLDVNLLVALAGATLGTGVSIAVEEFKLTNASQWTFLLRLPTARRLPRSG